MVAGIGGNLSQYELAYFIDLGKAVSRLQEVLTAPVDEQRVVIDATIQRFEVCIDLF